MESLVSVIIANRNGADTIGTCLAAAQASHHRNFEIIVVDDGSEDNSIEVIERYPCKLVRLEQHGGAPAPQFRNHGTRRGFRGKFDRGNQTLSLQVGGGGAAGGSA